MSKVETVHWTKLLAKTEYLNNIIQTIETKRIQGTKKDRYAVLYKEQENQLVKYLLDCYTLLYGITENLLCFFA